MWWWWCLIGLQGSNMNSLKYCFFVFGMLFSKAESVIRIDLFSVCLLKSRYRHDAVKQSSWKAHTHTLFSGFQETEVVWKLSQNYGC